MAENPELASTGPDTMVPVPFPGERLLCTRRGMKVEIKGIRGRTCALAALLPLLHIMLCHGDTELALCATPIVKASSVAETVQLNQCSTAVCCGVCPSSECCRQPDSRVAACSHISARNAFRWKAKGELFLSNVRMVFVAKHADADGLRAVDLPLVYVRGDRFNQPIFGCNNLSGECWPVRDDGGPGGSLPPLPYKCAFASL